MTGVIKSGAEGFETRVRAIAFEGAATAFAPPPDPEILELRLRVADLEAMLAERDAAAEALTKAADNAYAEGEAAGRAAGRAEAEDRGREALDLLGGAADRAVAQIEQSLRETDRLAALLARTCLDKLFGARDSRADLVRGLIRHQIESLQQQTVIEIKVSAADFASAEAASAAAPACTIVVSDALSSGDCAIQLRLGGLDIGLGQQWGTLRAALDGMIGVEEAA